MKIHHVQYFLALCEEENFTRAARRCGVSQPSLSNGIRALEKQLGGQLFHRGLTEVSVSELGRAVQHYFSDIEQAIRNIEVEAARLSGNKKQGSITNGDFQPHLVATPPTVPSNLNITSEAMSPSGAEQT